MRLPSLRRLLPWTIPLAAMLPASFARAEIYVIANPTMKLTADEAKEVFVGAKQLAGPVKLVPFDNASVRAEFLDRVYGMDAPRYETLWAKKAFREGLNAPAVKSSDLEVIASVKSTAGGVGYVSHPPGPGVTVISKY